MSISLLLITHDDVGTTLVNAATAVIGARPLRTELIAVYADSDPDELLEEARRRIAILGRDGGVLVLTDLYGSTPSNIACRLDDAERVMVVAGVNLPMLVRVMNYPGLGLTQLASKAVTGGSDGVFRCRSEIGSDRWSTSR